MRPNELNTSLWISTEVYKLSAYDIYKLMDTEGYAGIPQLWFNLTR